LERYSLFLLPGQDYHFIEVDEFERRVAQDFFLEWSNAYGTYYGSPRSMVNQIANGYSYIGIIDRVGASQIKAQLPEAVLVWIEAPSFQELSSRLRGRGTETSEQVERRLARAKIEMELERTNPIYDHLVINDQFSRAQKELEDLLVGYLASARKA
jgi:guanylate kinase